MSYAILVVLWIALIVAPASAGQKKQPQEGDQNKPTTIYVINNSPDVPAQASGGHWNQDVFNACVDLLRQHTELVAESYNPHGVALVIADPSENPKGWKAIFKSGGSGGYHSVLKGTPLAVAYTDSLLKSRSPCTEMAQQLAEMLGNPRPGSVCLTTPSGLRIEPEIVNPIWGSGYCPRGYEPECADSMAGPMPGFVMPAWFGNQYGVAGRSNQLTYPADVVSKPWQKSSGGAYFPCETSPLQAALAGQQMNTSSLESSESEDDLSNAAHSVSASHVWRFVGSTTINRSALSNSGNGGTTLIGDNKSDGVSSQIAATAEKAKKPKAPGGTPSPGEVAPPQAVLVGYTVNTFSGDFTDSNIDLRNKRKSGFKWYLWSFFDETPPSPDTIQVNGDGSVTFHGDTGDKGLSTVAPIKNHAKFVGTAFGGGLYTEAVLRFDPSTVVALHNSPAFWSMALEPILSSNNTFQWVGQPEGYSNHVEPDFFEYDPGFGESYGATLHDWYGIYNQTCKPGYCPVNAPGGKKYVPANTDFNQYHRYGFLWVPATHTTNGYVEFYFDGQLIGARISWTEYMDQPPPPALSKSWTFGVLDRQHLIINVQTGKDEPETVQSINVWQASSVHNLTQ